ncbi:FAD-dependent oxidoreductase [Stackebrandtia nassauensis]|uniref:Monooxygenase FAD-binding protein n=1 Tax=Stackebrandtia nassauensis (strain DSM 44728 / CIP 108903 / NRRL B-16338 / NBRC 102104 / LLR-40K-21) TaxID=446470 RepID=D3PWZ0_STANL|nr:FAD-dependent monooxygenase [Stackebrandtia nassauensis]ADD45214.1 monooxygenase FAD-binding protein [Stackebrandtia nassauensis DSM 44728]
MSRPRVLIIGAGLGGLALAHGLRDAGVDHLVVERDASVRSRRQGYRIHINADGSTALYEVLPKRLWELFRATASIPGPVGEFYDHRFDVVHRFEADGSARTVHGLPEHLNVNRLTLREILATGLDTVRYGRTFTGYRRDADGRVVAHFADGGTETGDLLVAADGVHSRVRRQRLPHARVVDSGLRLIYATVPLTPATRPLFPEGMFGGYSAILGPKHRHLGGAPVEFAEPLSRTASRIAADASLTEHRSYMTSAFGARVEDLPDDEELFAMNPSALRGLALDMMDDWHPRARRMVEHWELSSVLPLLLRTSVPTEPWPASEVTLLGDAVHAMSPAGGSGANAAMLDGAILAARLREVRDGKPLLEAVAEYENAMREHGFAAVRMSADNGHRMLGQDPLPPA